MDSVHFSVEPELMDEEALGGAPGDQEPPALALLRKHELPTEHWLPVSGQPSAQVSGNLICL